MNSGSGVGIGKVAALQLGPGGNFTVTNDSYGFKFTLRYLVVIPKEVARMM